MGGKAHGGERVSRQRAEDIFLSIDREMGRNQLFLCGSYRRGKESCGDLDIVIVPRKPGGSVVLDNWCIEHFGMQKNGKKPARNGLIDGVQVEFYVATPENLGTFLQMWTGSWQHNVELRKLALRKGYSMSQYGFRHKKTGELVECATEEEVYDFLGIDFVEPADR
jgi:DNA polymerase (family X)